MKFKFDSVFYYVSDLECAVRFYRDVLGFKLHSRDYVARFYLGDVLLELVPTSDTGKLQGKGNARLCLEVDNIRGSISELHAKGVPVQDAERKENGALTSFFDPDGNEVCLWQHVPQSPDSLPLATSRTNDPVARENATSRDKQ